MSPDQFNRLDYTRKTEAVLGGTFLAARMTEWHYVRLYNVGSFYVEVFFDDTDQVITHFCAFRHTNYVLPYLTGLKIAAL